MSDEKSEFTEKGLTESESAMIWALAVGRAQAAAPDGKKSFTNLTEAFRGAVLEVMDLKRDLSMEDGIGIAVNQPTRIKGEIGQRLTVSSQQAKPNRTASDSKKRSYSRK